MADAKRKRIIDHMNADHQDLLPLFLEVYCRVSRGTADSATMEDISLSELIIRANGTRYLIPFEPPLASLDNVRQRVIDMRDHCLKTLGISDIVVTEYRAPRGFGAVLFTTCLVTFIVFSQPSNFLPGSMLYTHVLHHIPPFAAFCYRVQPFLLPSMVVVHLIEAVHLAVNRLRPHRVPLFSGVWWAWIVNDFIEGYTTLGRFDDLVREKRNQQGKHA